MDPRHALLTSDAIASAQAVVAAHKAHTRTVGDSELEAAQRIVTANVHPDTGEQVITAPCLTMVTGTDTEPYSSHPDYSTYSAYIRDCASQYGGGCLYA